MCGKIGVPPSKPKYTSVIDSVEYREGKVKEIPGRGVKEILKRHAHKQSEPIGVTAYLLHNGSASRHSVHA